MGCDKKEVLHLNETDNRKEVKRKFALWIKESTLDMVWTFTRKITVGVEVNLLRRQSFSILDIFPQTTTVSIFPMWLPLH